MLQGLKVSSSMLSSWAAMGPRRRPLGEYGGLNLRQWLATWGLLCNGRVNPTLIRAWLGLQPEISGGRVFMVRASSQLPAARDRLADARDRFLAAEPVDPSVVRKPILASWWRSRQWNVAADHIELNYLHDPDLETTLARTADPVLRHLHEQLDRQPISIVLTGAAGLVLARLTPDHDLERCLDGVKLAPGFS